MQLNFSFTIGVALSNRFNSGLLFNSFFTVFPLLFSLWAVNESSLMFTPFFHIMENVKYVSQ